MARFDADPMNLRDPQSESVKAFQRLAAEGAASPLGLSVIAADAAEAEKIARRIERSAAVDKAVWLGDLTPKDQAAKLDLLDLAYPSLEHAAGGAPTQIDAATAYTPTSLATELEGAGDAAGAALAAALRAYAAADRRERDPAALEADLFRHFPAFMARIGAMLEADAVSPEALPAPLRERFATAQGAQRVEISAAEDLSDPAAMKRFADAVLEIEPRAAGGPVQIAGAAETVSGAMAEATALALGATALLAWLALGRLGQTLAILAPLASAGVITAAIGVLIGAPFNYANVIVLPLIIGVGVDSGVHLALRDVAVGD